MTSIVELIDKIKERKGRGSITLHFDGQGNDPSPELDLKVKGNEVFELFGGKEVKKPYPELRGENQFPSIRGSKNQ